MNAVRHRTKRKILHRLLTNFTNKIILSLLIMIIIAN
ncbi:cation-transporting P-type ATPase [Mesobacillus jeotgali]